MASSTNHFPFFTISKRLHNKTKRRINRMLNTISIQVTESDDSCYWSLNSSQLYIYLGVTPHTLSRASFSNRGNEELREAKQFVIGYGL